MELLDGVRYVRLAPGAAEAVAPYLDMTPDEGGELVLGLERWPEEIRPVPLRALDGRLLEGDPYLLDAGKEGLVLAGAPVGRLAVLVRWNQVIELRVIAARRSA